MFIDSPMRFNLRGPRTGFFVPFTQPGALVPGDVKNAGYILGAHRVQSFIQLS